MQRNTIISLCLILIAGYLTSLGKNQLDIKNIYSSIFMGSFTFIVIYLVLFGILEYLYYFKKIRIKSEREALENSYDWFDFTMHPTNFDTDKGDLTEGLYGNDYEMSASDAMKNKYDSYYNYLKLKPGMNLLDLGCGYCHWSKYLKKKGINVTGLTLSKPQKEMCESHKIKVYNEDFRRFIQLTNSKYEAVSALGSLEHLTSSGMTSLEEERVHYEFFRNINRVLKPNGNAIITVCNMNPKYKGWKIYSNLNNGKNNKYTMKDSIHMYNLASFYGCGRYPHVKDYKRYLNKYFDMKNVRNITEDYRWAGIKFGDNHWQNSKIFINTPYRLLKLCQYIISDPWILGRLNYSRMKSWYWQFGGDQKTPIINNDSSPIIVNCYVLNKKNYDKSWKNDPDALKLIS